MSKVENEKVVAALLEHGTVTGAAESLGISPRSIYERRRDIDFQVCYNDAKNEIIRAACYSINQKLGDAVETISNIMNDPTANPAVRLQAANSIICNAAKMLGWLEKGERESRTMRDPFDVLGYDLN